MELQKEKLKYTAGRVSDLALRFTPLVAASATINTRRRKPYRLSALSGLVVGTLCERGYPEIAENYIDELLNLG